MAFYTQDDDNDDDGLKQDEFFCPNCGGQDSYRDGATGMLVCTSCFTQSQAHTQAEVEVDEMQTLVARNRSGNVMGLKRSQNHEMGRPRGQLEDHSEALPNVADCLAGFQQVLRHCTTIATDQIAGLDNGSRKTVHTIVRRLWIGYLQSWQDGADFYGSYHPEVRFCMRDLFLRSPMQKSVVLRYLSHRANLQAFKEEDVIMEPGTSKRESPRGDSVIHQMLCLYNRRGRREAALRLHPSMSLVLSFLCIPLSRLGYTAQHIVGWVTNGRIPLLHAFRTCLKKDMQQKLHLVSAFFRLDRVPTSRYVERSARILFVAAGTQHTVPTLVTQDAVPLLAARFVTDMGLGQRVLDLTLALMGRLERRGGEWLPAPLVHRVTTRAQVLGVMVVACKLCPGWETWKLCQKHAIPWNDQQRDRVHRLKPYLDHFEQDVLSKDDDDDNDNLLPSFLRDSNDEDEIRNDASGVIPLGLPNPNQPAMKRRQKYHDFYLRLGKQKALWADANGLGEYVVYDDSSLGCVHPHLTNLIEYMSYATDTCASRITRMVLELDREITNVIPERPIYERRKRRKPSLSSKVASNKEGKPQKRKRRSSSAKNDSEMAAVENDETPPDCRDPLNILSHVVQMASV